MDDFGLLARDFGYKPQGKSAPMIPPRSGDRSTPLTSDIDYDSIFTNNNIHEGAAKPGPVYDKPVYDDDDGDDIFEGVPGMKTKSRYSSAPLRFDQFDHLPGPVNRTPMGFDDLLPGFGSTNNRSGSESVPVSTTNTKAIDDPFGVLESKSIPKVGKSQSTNAGRSSVKTSIFDDLDPLHEFGKPAPAENNNKNKDQSPPYKQGSNMSRSKSSSRREPTPKVHVESFQDSHQPVFDMPPVNRATSPSSYTESNSQADMPPSSEEHDIWLTVSEIPLFTQPTRAPPPSRPPPPIPARSSKPERSYFASNTRIPDNDSPSYTNFSQTFNPFQSQAKSPMASTLDEFESFASGTHDNGEEIDSNSATAAMKDAMDRAEAKFRHAKELRERENLKASRNKESMKQQKDEMSTEEEEREKARLERERERQAVERATREARERAAAEAREKASAEARLKAERAAVQRAQAEARERAAIDAKERAERAAREARERASAEASEKAAAEAREKAAREKAAVARAEADARRRAERAAVDRVAAEARERAAADARERAAAAAAAKVNQQKNDNDLESFFSSRPSSAPRPRSTSDSAPDPLFQNRRGPEGSQRTSSTGAPSNMRKASSTTNIVDDLSSIFGAAPSSAGEFQDVEGETEERRRARLERQQRTQERAAKALAEKNNRDLQTQREQEERHRISETLDVEIKRWAAGKEGNLRALLSTLQYVLWPGCGWQPVSLTDLITGANVKKAYRKATLCIHPDKVQQKGANLQQKYVAEKVFDLLKEAWNKFNSEELF